MKIKITKIPPYNIEVESKIKLGTIRTVLSKNIIKGNGIVEYKIAYKGKYRFVTNEYCIEF